MAYRRTSLPWFSLGNRAYINGLVTLYKVDASGNRLTTLATLYDGATGSGTLTNPQSLDGDGKFAVPVYIAEPVIALVASSEIGSHETGVFYPLQRSYRGAWAVGQSYVIDDIVSDGAAGAFTLNLYSCNVEHVSAVWATELAAEKWLLMAPVGTEGSRIAAQTAATAAAASATSATASAVTATTAATAAALSLNYTAPGSAVVRTTAAKVGESLSVLDFGALGDGSTDDTAAFQLAANQGGVITVPTGTYIVSTVNLNYNSAFIGEGDASIIKRKAGIEGTSVAAATGAFVVATHGITVEIKDLLIDGNEAAQNPYESYGYGIRFGNLTSAAGSKLVVLVDNVTFQNTTQAAISADGLTGTDALEELTVTGCRFRNTKPGRAQGDVLVLATTGYGPDYITCTDKVYATITGNSFVWDRVLTTGDFPPSGIRITFSVDVGNADAVRTLIDGNYFRGVGRGHTDISGTNPGNDVGCIDFYARGRALRITNNYFENCCGVPVRGKTNADLAVISGNIIDSILYGPGINVSPATYDTQTGRIIISNNIIKNTYGYAIGIIGNVALTPAYAQDVLISGNIIDTVATYSLNGATAVGYGIYTRYAHGVTITDNQVRSVGQYGIYVLNTQDGIVANNRVESSGTRNFNVTSATGRYVVSGNTSVSSGNRGFELVATSGGTEVLACSDNISDGAVDYGFFFRYWTRASLIGNQAYNVTGSGRGYYAQDISGTIDYAHNVAGVGVATPTFNAITTTTGIRLWGNSWERRQAYGTAAPGSGAWLVGDTVWNTAPAAAGSMGWVCTTAGSPGTWKAFGTIAA